MRNLSITYDEGIGYPDLFKALNDAFRSLDTEIEYTGTGVAWDMSTKSGNTPGYTVRMVSEGTDMRFEVRKTPTPGPDGSDQP